MSPAQLINLRHSFDFTQKQMADILGIHPNALQNMEYGKNPIPKYIRNYALSLTALNENGLLLKHIKIIGVDDIDPLKGYSPQFKPRVKGAEEQDVNENKENQKER